MEGTPSEFTGSITMLLRRAREGDRQAEASLIERVYPELRRIAQSMLSTHYRPTTGAGDGTGLVHDACCRLLEREQLTAQDRKHFFFLLGRAMQDELTEQARADMAQKRGGSHQQVEMDPSLISSSAASCGESMEVREAIERLRVIDPDGARVAELRCLMGLSLESTAATMGSTVPVVRRHWKYAKAWLKDHMSGEGGAGFGPDPDSASKT